MGLFVLDKTYTIPQPVRSSRQTDTTSTDGERIDFADDDPGTGTPGAGKEEDIDADERNHGRDGFGVVAIGHTDDGHDEFADEHACGSPDEERASAELLDGPERNRSGENVDQGGDQANQEGVLDGSERLKEGGSEVEDEVDTGPLLHHLERGAEDDTTEVARLVPEAATEAIGP